MENLNLSNIEVDEEALEDTSALLNQSIEDTKNLKKQKKIVEENDQQIVSEQQDPRNKENWGVAGVTKELQSALTGGLQDTASSIQTFPERVIDTFTGEVQREKEEKGSYQPEWSPFVDEQDPIITRTWWGQMLRGTVHFGSMAVGVVAAAKAAGITAPAWLSGMAGYSLIRAAGVGVVTDTISHTTDGENALGMMRDRFGWMDTPLSTRDTDSPMMMKFKNIVEGMGIGILFDSAALALGKGGQYAKAQVAARNQSVELQTVRKGLQELRKHEFNKSEPGFRASKNAPVAGRHQGNHLSEEDPFVVWERQKKINNEWGMEEGSAGNITTPIQRERIARESGITADLVENVLSKLYSKDKFRRIVQALDGDRQRLVEVFGDAIAAHQRITQGRNAAEMSAEEYLKEILATSDRFDITDISGKKVAETTTITAKNVVVSDLVVSTLLQQVRDLGIAGREIADFDNLLDIDAPGDQILDTLLVALAESKRAKYTLSREFAALGAKRIDAIQEAVKQEVKDAREQIQTILKIAKEDDDGDLMLAMFEAFSSMQNVNSVDDFVGWARKMIRGGEIEGKQQVGALIRELQGVMIHSVLSGPKTPIRAIMGTSTATFLRPLSQAIGGMMMYPFNGDSITMRAGLAQLNGMMQAIPESWELFRSRLNGYWSGDISTIKTRFSEFTKGDQNWEILRRFAESDEATAADKASFYMANMARSANDSNFLTYSTKLMAATDDAFAYILGRAKMREKAFRSAADAHSRGALTAYTEVTPELIKFYEDDFYRQIFDGNGNIIDEATKFARKEVTLTQELTGFPAGLNQVFQATPWARPFFLFARTGVNGLALTAKHTPCFNFFVKEWNDIAFARPDNLQSVAKYGITTVEELANAKALQVGRLAMGTSLISMTAWSWMSGNVTGNGPTDRQKRQSWIDAGWRPRQIKLGDVWINYDSFEPFNQILSTVADIGDASQLMGEEWTKNQLATVSLVIAQGITSKSYLAGMQQFVDLFAGRPGQANRIVAGLMNNQVPLAGLRNELGKIFTPYMRELNSGIGDAIRNRNLISENLPGQDLPIKYDILNGKPIKDHDPITRMFNAISPVNFNLDYSEARSFLFRSGYDLRMSTYSSPGPNGIDLSSSPLLRSKFQKAIGERNLEKELLKLSKNPKVIASLIEMERDIANGDRGAYESKDYYHNRAISKLFTSARRNAWRSLMNDPKVSQEAEIQLRKKSERKRKTSKTSQVDSLLYIYK